MKKPVLRGLIFAVCFALMGGAVYAYLVFRSGDVTLKPFLTLGEAEQYARSKPEYPPMDNTIYLKPDYSSFYKRRHKGMLTRIKSAIINKLTAERQILWTPQAFHKLLLKVTKERNEKEFGGEHVLKYAPQEGDKIVLWGDLQGAFHSLIRDLRILQKLEYINEDLKIKDGIKFVFNGDAISRSPFIMETFTLLLRIMDFNPDKVLWIKGNHERNRYWCGYGLKTELKLRARHLSSEKIPLGGDADIFFNTLPLGIFVGMRSLYNRNFLQITHIEPGRIEKTDIANIESFLLREDRDSSVVSAYRFDGNLDSDKRVNIKAIITGQDREFTYENNEGLLLLPSIGGATTWTALSCPTLAYKSMFDYHHDAFSVITSEANSLDWRIALYNQDAVKKDGFKVTEYSLLTGAVVSKTKPLEE